MDSLSGSPAAAGAILLTYDLAHNGARIDSVVGLVDNQPLFGAVDVSGRFRVVVRKNGYRDWVQSQAIVERECEVRTVALTARLVRQ